MNTNSAPESWGPRLYEWLEGYWRANDTNANAWTHAHPGLQGGTVSRWRTGTVPSLPAMRSVADAVGMPFVDVLVVAGVLDAGEVDRPAPSAPPAPSVDVAIEQDPTLSPVARRSLRDILRAIRDVESGAAQSVTVGPVAKRTRRRGVKGP